MFYSADQVLEYIKEEDVKFIRLAFTDVSGKKKNLSIMPSELPRAFEDGMSIDASSVDGFGGELCSDLLLFPDPSTLQVLPWRPTDGKVVRMYCDIRHPDGTPFALDCRRILINTVRKAADKGITCNFGAEFEFFLFKTDDKGDPTMIPFDNAGYMDIAPEDKGENVRREICLTLEQMGIFPERSHHEDGPGQNEIDFRYSDPVTAADNAVTFKMVVKTIAARSGLWADFSPKPFADKSGNGLHINMSVQSRDGADLTGATIAGIMENISAMTAFLNPTEESYRRLGEKKAPKYISWSPENRSQLIRIPAAKGKYKRIELRSPDAKTNPYLAFTLLIDAVIDGIEKRLEPCPAANINLFEAPASVLANFRPLPSSLEEAKKIARESEFIRRALPEGVIDINCK